MSLSRREWLEKRLWLAELLCEAAELEHALACKYLFAAFSLKEEEWEGDVTWQQLEMIRGWETTLLLIARQEMEHLALVCNLLTAIGEAPYLRRPNFPVSGTHYQIGIKCELECFSQAALRRFIEFEMPEGPDKELLASVGITFDRKRHTTIGRLYREIEGLFHELRGSKLFIGPQSAQLVTSPGKQRGLTLAAGPTYEVSLSAVRTEKSATKVINRIIEEGEGSPGDTLQSHFGRLCTMYKQLAAEKRKKTPFDPVRHAVPDATHTTGGSRSKLPRLTGMAFELVGLFDLAYETLILLLIRFIAHSDELAGEVSALQSAAFFPMMTAVIRPLGDIITQLPRSPGSGDMAGPSFRFDRELSLLPHRESADRTIYDHLELLALRCAAYAARDELQDLRPRKAQSRGIPKDVRPRLELMSQNLSRMAMNFNTSMKG